MRNRRLLPILTGALCIALLLVAFLASRDRAALRAQLTTAQARQHSLENALRAAAPAATPAIDPPISPPTTSPPPTAPSPPTRKRAPGLLDLARENPALWDEWINARQAEFARTYGPLFQNLALSPAQREKIKAIKAAEIARSTDIAAAADARQLPRNDPTVAALSAQSEKQMEADLAALLGEQGYAEFMDYTRTLMVRGLADSLAVQVAAIDPLTAHQADRLTHALANASPAYLKGNQPTSKDVDWASVDQQAQVILSPAQYAIWQQGTAHSLYGGSRRDVELAKIYQQAVAASKAGAPAP